MNIKEPETNLTIPIGEAFSSDGNLESHRLATNIIAAAKKVLDLRGGLSAPQDVAIAILYAIGDLIWIGDNPFADYQFRMAAPFD